MRISDWSSDVCSSDLTGGQKNATKVLATKITLQLNTNKRRASRSICILRVALCFGCVWLCLLHNHDRQWQRRANTTSSEERRGGKECVSTGRSRWSPYN